MVLLEINMSLFIYLQ